ncbi:MAG TPA: hypothetical protein VGP37_09110, partial [Candidatus Nanopelagicales bacterium]|nr:hypothetical protein [Candidatus Nanopelagicales bacterium]
MRLSKSIRYLAVSSATALTAGLLTVPSASAATEYFESFTDADVTYSSDWAAGRFSLGTLLDYPCLTARPAASGDLQLNPGPGTLFTCQTTPDASGSGALRLADDSTTAEPDSSDINFTQPFLTSGGFDITFSMAMYDTSSSANQAADGISFFLKDGSSTNYAPGYPGGWLGYIDVADALVGVGFDYFGNFSTSNTALKLNGCSTDGPGQRANAIVVRGPGERTGSPNYNGYCYLAGTSANAMNFSGTENTRAQATRRARVQVDAPTVASPKVRVYFDDLTNPILTVDQPQELQQSRSFKFGFAGSSGGSFAQFLEIWNLRFTGTPVPPPPPPVQMITLDIDANEGSCTVSKITEPVGTWVDLPGEDACSREGYEFLGFDTSASSTTPQFAPGAPVQLTGDNRVYAIYEEIVPEPFLCTP